ncbi:MAG: protein kinase [Verrucomicrobiota bacterium]|jgi:WD40 repeat protein/serine/threonine protein kinase
MMGEAKHETRAVFTAALALSAPEERARYLDEACQGKPELRQRVEVLLCAHEQASSFLEQPAAPSPRKTIVFSPPLTEKPGDKIGHYKLLEEIGEGAFGRVFMAEQTEPVCRKVALKIIKAGMDTREVIARFEAERQALALMDHPNIAKVLDAGATETGRPYFVMELVRGIPITAYCEQQQLSTAGRLQLFMKVCHAVQHAHQKGIIHRDLKPTNILVTLIDGEAVPKVIDFGIAKALGQKLTEKTLFTAFQQMVGTPAYMSPEQAALSGVDVDTRSDIYSLGVLLYELLTGVTPFDQETLRKAALDEICRLIRETEPPKPSTRLTQLARSQKSEVRSQKWKEVHGDLDWIVMKCLEKDRARRYETANSLADDIERHLKLEPVNAAAPSALYLAGKFVRRHKAGLATATALVLFMVVGAVVSTWQAVRATRAEREQTQLREAAETAREQVEARAYASDMSLAAHSASSGANLGSVEDLLARWRHSEPDRRGWEWYYLNGLCHREILTIDADTNGLRSVAWSPDGRRLASAGRDGVARLWDPSTGRKIAELRGHAEMVECVAWSPDSRRLATSSRDNTIRVWEAETASAVLTLTGHNDAVFSVAWSRDGKKLASVSWDRTARIWDAATGAEVLTVTNPEPLHGVSWNADGTCVAVCSGDTTTVLDTVTGKRLRMFDSGVRVAWSPDGKWLAGGGYDSWVKIMDAVTGTNVVMVGLHGEGVLNVAWSPDGMRLASACQGEGTVKIWDARNRTEVRSFRGHAGSVREVSWRPDGEQLASAGIDGTVKVWDAKSGNPSLSTKTQPAQCLLVAWRPDGQQLACGGSDGLVRVWDIAGTRDPTILHAHTGWAYAMGWNPTGTRIASGGQDGLIKVWEPTTGQELWHVQAYTRVQDHRKFVRSLAWSPDGKRLASVGEDNYLNIWDADTGAKLVTTHFHGSTMAFAVAWRPDGKQLAVGLASARAGEIQLLDAATGKLEHAWLGHRDTIRSVAWRPDGKQLASASDDTTVKVWDTETGREIHTLFGHSSMVRSVAWNPDGTRLASGSWDRTVRIWDPATGEEVCSIAEPIRTAQVLGAVFAVAWSPDGTQIASADEGGTILIHNCTPGRAAEEKRKLAEFEKVEIEKPPAAPPR